MFENLIGSTELTVIIAALLLLFGGKTLSKLAKGLGEAIREFKKSLEGKWD